MVEYFKQKTSGFKPRPAIDPGQVQDLFRGADGGYAVPRKKGSGVPNSGFKPGYRGQMYYNPTPDRSYVAPSNPGRSSHQYNRNWDAYGGTKDSFSGKLPKYRGFAAGFFGFVMDNQDVLQNWDWSRFWENGDLPWGLSGDEIIRELNRQNGILPGEVSDDIVDKRPNVDGHDYYFAYPKSGTPCHVREGWFPDQRWINANGFPRGYLQIGPVGHVGTTGANCATWGTRPRDPVAGWHPSYRYQAVMTCEWSFTNQAWVGGSQPVPAFAVRIPGSEENPRDISWARVPIGDPAPLDKLGVSNKPSTYMPTDTSFGFAPDPNNHPPKPFQNAVKGAAILTGNRIDSGYNPSGGPHMSPGSQVIIDVTHPTTPGGGHVDPPKSGTTSPEPWHPPGKQEKMRVKGWAAFKFVQEVFHGITESDDLVSGFYDALPKRLQTCKTGGPVCKAAVVGKHWKDVDKVEAIVNVIYNHFEDKVLGRIMSQRDKAARRWGSYDYKFQNDAGAMDDPMFQLYGEIAKHGVNPSKEAVTSAIKNYLGVQ